MQIKLISISIVEHQDSLRNRDKQQLENGLLNDNMYTEHKTCLFIHAPHSDADVQASFRGSWASQWKACNCITNGTV